MEAIQSFFQRRKAKPRAGKGAGHGHTGGSIRAGAVSVTLLWFQTIERLRSL